MSSTKDERTPLAAAAPAEGSGGSQSLRAVALAVTTVCFSVGLINFNNYLMEEGRFPYAAPLVLIHMGFCSTLAFALRLAQPELFPALTDPHKRVPLDRAFVVQGALPIAAVFAASLVLTNLAYQDLSVAFLQMMKESNIVLVYVFSLIAALEAFSWRHVQVILFAVAAASLTIKGELHFALGGFVIQLASQCCECTRIVLQSVLLSGRKLDALSYVLIISPICFVVLGTVIALVLALPEGLLGPGLAVPSGETLCKFGPLLVANCFVAFGLNVSIALLIKHTSAMSYIFVGVLKDIVAVLVSVLVLSEAVSTLQAISFTMQICSVVTWSLLKARPEKFERGLFGGFVAVAEEAIFAKAGEEGAAAEQALEALPRPSKNV